MKLLISLSVLFLFLFTALSPGSHFENHCGLSFDSLMTWERDENLSSRVLLCGSLILQLIARLSKTLFWIKLGYFYFWRRKEKQIKKPSCLVDVTPLYAHFPLCDRSTNHCLPASAKSFLVICSQFLLYLL